MEVPSDDGSLHLLQYVVTSWTPQDHRRLRVNGHDPAAQPLWGAYILYLAVLTWSDFLVQHAGPPVFRGDAEGMLQAVVFRRARCAPLNTLIVELSLLLGGSIHDVRAVHWWSEKNSVCDAQRRSSEGVPIPQVLSDARPDTVVRRPWA